MRKIRIYLTILFITAASVSCNMTEWDDIVSLDINPTLINKTPRIYPGGNADCSSINIPGLIQTTGRNNYNPNTDAFENGWPAGLLVKVNDDKTVSFQISGSINLGDGKCYTIGAVIVKGGDASNVYNYTDIGGATMDKGLVSPNNSSGGPAGLSNLTFCFMECTDNPEWIIALKTYVTTTGQWDWAISGGTGSSTNSLEIGYNPYVFNSSEPNANNYPLNYMYNGGQIGNISASDYWENGIHYFEVVIDAFNDDWSFLDSYLYVGTLTGYNKYVTLRSDGKYVTDYMLLPFHNSEKLVTRTFKIPFSDIKE